MKESHPLNPLQAGAEAMSAVWQTEGVRRTTGVGHTAGQPSTFGPANRPDPEVPEKRTRRKFTAAYKLRVLHEAEQCRHSGEIGALLRREGLYSSHLSTWRRQRDEGVLQGLNPKKRGRKAKPKDSAVERISLLERENQRLKIRLRKAEIIIEAQKKISEILGIEQNLDDLEGDK